MPYYFNEDKWSTFHDRLPTESYGQERNLFIFCEIRKNFITRYQVGYLSEVECMVPCIQCCHKCNHEIKRLDLAIVIDKFPDDEYIALTKVFKGNYYWMPFDPIKIK